MDYAADWESLPTGKASGVPAGVPANEAAAYRYVSGMTRQGIPATAAPTASGGFEVRSPGSATSAALRASEGTDWAADWENLPATAKPVPAVKPVTVNEANINAPSEVVGAVASGIGATVLGGLHGLYKLATTGSADEAANAVNSTREALTYQPKSPDAQKAVQVIGSGWNPLNWPSIAAHKVAEYGVDTGYLDPARAAGIEAIGTVVTPGSFLKGAGLLRPAAKAAAKEAPFASGGAAAATTAQSTKTALSSATPELQKAVAPVKDINPPALARQVEADSLPVPIRLTAGQASQDLKTLSNEYNTRAVTGVGERFKEQNQQIIQNLEAIRDEAAPEVFGLNHVDNGQAIIDAYKATDKEISKDITAKYKALEDANGGQFPIDAKTFAETAEKALHREYKFDYLDSAIKNQLERFKNGEPMTFEQFETLRTNLATDARTATGNTAHAASTVRKTLEAFPLPPEAAALKPLADAARGAARARFALIEKDPAYKAIMDKKVAADDFINRFVIKGKRADVQTMVSHLGPDSVAHQTMKAGVINYLRKTAGITEEGGNVSQANYNKALEGVRPKLSIITGEKTARQLDTLGKVAKYTQVQPRGAWVNNSNTWVAAVGSGVKKAAEVAANNVVGLHLVPVGTMVRESAAKRALAKQAQRSLQTGAGVSLKDIGK